MNIIFRSYIYDALYITADQIIKKYNPCQICENEFGAVHCIRDFPCCGGCEFLGPDGCTTECLMCKLHLCTAAADADIKLYKILWRTVLIARRYCLLEARVSKKDIFNRLRRSKHYNTVMANTIGDLKSVLEKSGGT